MKTPTKTMLQLDAILQGLLIIPMLFCYLPYLLGAESESIIFGLIAQFFLGCLQLLSGFARVIRHQSKIREKYLQVAISYVAFLIIGGNMMSYLLGPITIIPFLFVVPIGIALWYWRLTILQASGKFAEMPKAPLTLDESMLTGMEQDDLLIDDILQRHQNRIKQSR